MGNSRLVIAVILACMVSTPFSLFQYASSQSFTSLTVVQQLTSTAITAVTSSLTTTMSTPQYVRYDLTPKDFSQTGTFTLGYSEFAPLPYYPGDHLCLMYDYFMLNATTAHEFKIHFATQQDIPIHFLILNAEQFNEFNHTNCVDRPFGWELHVLAPTSDQDWVVPERGEYVLLFFSRHFLGGRIYLSVQAYGQAMQVSTSAYTKTNFIELLSTQTITSTLPNVTPPTDNFAFILPAIIIGLVLVAGTVILKRHTKS